LICLAEIFTLGRLRFLFGLSVSGQLELSFVKQTLGLFMQLAALSVLPAIVIFQLFYGFRLIVMPISLLCGICVFSIGTVLRESR